MSTTVLISAVWLVDAVDPTDALGLSVVGSIKVTSSVPATAQPMAGGRTRLVTKEGTSWTASAVFTAVTPDQVSWIRSHEGRAVWLLDHQGTKLSCFYAEVPADESVVYRTKASVELSFTGVTVSEAV